MSLSRNKINIGKSFSKCVSKISVRPLLCYSSQSIDSYYSVSLAIDSHMGNFPGKNSRPRSKLQLESSLEVVVIVLKNKLHCLLKWYNLLKFCKPKDSTLSDWKAVSVTNISQCKNQTFEHLTNPLIQKIFSILF